MDNGLEREFLKEAVVAVERRAFRFELHFGEGQLKKLRPVLEFCRQRDEVTIESLFPPCLAVEIRRQLARYFGAAERDLRRLAALVMRTLNNQLPLNGDGEIGDVAGIE